MRKTSLPEDVVLPETEFARVKKVDNVNYRPDLFCITPRHLARSEGIYVQPEVAPCGHCKKDYDEHSWDTVAFIELKREATEAEMRPWMQEVVGPFLVQHDIDGAVFVETPQKFRVVK